MSEAMLEFREVDVFYGPIRALRRVAAGQRRGDGGADRRQRRGQIHAVDVDRPAAHRRRADPVGGEDISRRSTHYVAAGGIAQAPEGRRIFPDMSVEENLLMGTITVGNRYLEEDLPRMFELFPRLRSGATSGR